MTISCRQIAEQKDNEYIWIKRRMLAKNHVHESCIVTSGIFQVKCALIIPAWVPEDIFSSKTASSQINYWQPLGTLYVAAVLQKKVMK